MLIGALAALSACSSSQPDEPVAWVDAAGRVFGVPPETHVVDVHDGIRLDFRPGARSPRQIDLLASPHSRHASADCPWTDPKTASWEHSTLTYSTSTGCGGSGGVEAKLDGAWMLGDRTIHVRCHTQDEVFFGEIDPTWCLPYLKDSLAP